jgi:hypothetical protein
MDAYRCGKHLTCEATSCVHRSTSTLPRAHALCSPPRPGHAAFPRLWLLRRLHGRARAYIHAPQYALRRMTCAHPTVMLVQQKLKCSSQRLLLRTALSQQGSDATGGGRSRHCEGASPRACTAATAPANCPGPAVQAGPPRSCHMSPWALQNARSDNAVSGSGDRTFTTTTM